MSFPNRENLTICFGHVAYQFADRFAQRETGLRAFQAWSRDELEARIGEADVLLVSGLWKNELLAKTGKLKFVQSISAGTDQYARDKFAAHGVRLASAAGANANAVSEHAMSLILAITRRLPEARDNQAKKHWRGMIGDLGRREDEVAGKTLVIVGMGTIGSRLAKLAKAFDMRVIGIRRAAGPGGPADEVRSFAELPALLPQADFVALTCALTPDTEKLIDAAALGLMKPSAYLVNVARGKVVDEPALIDALQNKRIAGAGIDVTLEEPLPAASPLWTLETAFVTPHTGGETRRYEDNVIDILLENLDRLWRGETALRNQIV